MKTQCLFIGGPAAGKIIEVEAGRSEVCIPVFQKQDTTTFQPGMMPTDSTFNHAVYRRDCATDKTGKRHTLYVEESVGDPLIEIMNYYATGAHQ